MKRRDFFGAAGVGAATVLVGPARASQAQKKRPPEKRLQVYKCEQCGAIVEILEPGFPSLVHCGEPMVLLEEMVEGEGAEKHIPVVEPVAGGYKVKVGEVTHPMLRSHYIAWIDLIADGLLYRKFLDAGAGDPPEAVFLVDAKEVSARAYCNLHGLWKSK